MKARLRRARRQRRLAPLRARMKAWHDGIAEALAEARAAGVTLEELNAALGVWYGRKET